ncbi:hypothetical protein BC938DRAFT_481325 [Jimgerdemannia flammicorona]|uniref:P-loop containing nucleoside triphosphate hydrolase protein n=1 Tax=Jimgerdemannia flammicorona TaxID=994334 RepID=A0A433QX20_9FUNG|nr:hypothetical protein BC938DRAFT_481325 [Jimgerdemannia flammicorona]
MNSGSTSPPDAVRGDKLCWDNPNGEWEHVQRACADRSLPSPEIVSHPDAAHVNYAKTFQMKHSNIFNGPVQTGDNADFSINYIIPLSPPPGTVVHVPEVRNSRFVGRQDGFENRELNLLNKDIRSCRRIALTGLGGIGKTQIAFEYCYRYKSSYSADLGFRFDNTFKFRRRSQAAQYLFQGH